MSRLFLALVRALLREKPEAILLQNPPSFPTLTAVAPAAKLLRARVVVDWHNYGFSLLTLRFGNSHWLVRMARWYEFSAGRFAARHLCVSRAMREDLLRNGIRAEVVYDKPWIEAEPTREASEHSEHSGRIMEVYPAGWTGDENIELLMNALELVPETAVTVYITGEGAKEGALVARLRALRVKGVLMNTGFLSEAEYRALIRRADLGLSLHRSSSRLDLAMKVVDLFGGGLPVCALDYGGSIGEQIDEGVTGFLFRTPQELAALFTRLSSNPEMLFAMREAVRERWRPSWSEEWKRAVLPALAGDGKGILAIDEHG